jgi:hypothetical protein
MPSTIVKSFADKTGKSIEDVERLWGQAKVLASKEGHSGDYAYITGILKKMLKLEQTKMKKIKEFLPEGRFGDFLARAQGRAEDNFAKVVDGTNPIVTYKGAYAGKQMMMPLKDLTDQIGRSHHKKALASLFKTRQWKHNKITYHLFDGDQWLQKKMLKGDWRPSDSSGGNSGHSDASIWGD